MQIQETADFTHLRLCLNRHAMQDRIYELLYQSKSSTYFTFLSRIFECAKNDE